MAGRTWFPRDCNLTADPKAQLLGAEFGAEGVLAFEEAIAVAKLAQAGGHAKMAYTQLASRAWVKSAKKSGLIVAAMGDLGLIDLGDVNGRTFDYRLSKWTRWNDATAAERQAAARARANGEVT